MERRGQLDDEHAVAAERYQRVDARAGDANYRTQVDVTNTATVAVPIEVKVIDPLTGKPMIFLVPDLAYVVLFLPMVLVDKPYRFEGPDGTVGLLDLFDGTSRMAPLELTGASRPAACRPERNGVAVGLGDTQ